VRSHRSLPRAAGFTLTELAVVFAIVALLLGGLLYTLAAQIEQKNIDDTRQRLELARELLLSFAIVKGRLPCPARHASAAGHSAGQESFCIAAPPAACPGAETTAEQDHGNCSSYDGLLPAASIGWRQVDHEGFAVDAWGGRIRYAVARLNTNCAVPPPPNTRLYTSAVALKAYGLSCRPANVLVCRSSSGISATSCGGSANQVTSQDLIVAVVYSIGKNAALGPAGADEAANLNGDAIFVWHPPTPSGAAGGAFDDQLVWIPVGELYARLVAAGVLP